MHARSDVSIQDLLRTGLLQPGEQLSLLASAAAEAVVEADGTLLCGGRRFRSPSLAANAAVGSHLNGWRAWRVRRGGSRVTLDALRREYRALQAQADARAAASPTSA